MNRADPTPTPDDGLDDLAYTDAVAELEAILAELEDDTVDVDVVATRVARAAALIRLCRARIRDTRMEVEQIVGELAEPGPPTDEG